VLTSVAVSWLCGTTPSVHVMSPAVGDVLDIPGASETWTCLAERRRKGLCGSGSGSRTSAASLDFQLALGRLTAGWRVGLTKVEFGECLFQYT